MEIKKNLYFKSIALATLVCFSGSTVSAEPAVTVARPSNLTSTEVRIPDKMTFPAELGTLQEFSHSDSSDRFVIYIQDAHAIVDAQKNMQALIEFFQQQFNIRFVAVEGTQSNLDPLLFKTFPDEFVKKKVLAEYAAKGELSGSEMAAIFSPMPATYVGLEQWGLYQENHDAYLQADALEEKLLKAFQGMSDGFDRERKSVYSPEFNAFHEKVTAFRDEKLDLFKLMKFLQTLDPQGSRLTENRFPHLFPVFKAAVSEDRLQDENIEVTLRRMADHLKTKIEGKLTSGDMKEFNEKYQTFVTGQIDAGTFLKYLVDSGKKINITPKLTPRLRELLGQTETLGMIKGTKLFEELETLLTDYENEFAKTPEQKDLSVRYHRLRVLTDLTRLEWTREQFNEYSADEASFQSLAGSVFPDLAPALKFYKLAMERDSVFLDRIEKVMDREKTKGVIVLTGGFHAEGFEQRLRERHYSYAVIMPKMNSLEGHENYAPVMKGDLSYKRFLKTTLYDAFVKDASLKMVSEMSEPDFRRNIKTWRDDVIRELSNQGRIEKSGEYTKYIDQLFRYYADRFGFNAAVKNDDEILKGVNDEVEKLNQETLADLVEKFQIKSQAFLSGFKELASGGKLNLPQIKDLYARVSSGQPSAVAIPPSLSPDGTVALFTPSRSEVRAITAPRPGLDIVAGDMAIREVMVEIIALEKLLKAYTTGDKTKNNSDVVAVRGPSAVITNFLDRILGKGNREFSKIDPAALTLDSLNTQGTLSGFIGALTAIQGNIEYLSNIRAVDVKEDEVISGWASRKTDTGKINHFADVAKKLKAAISKIKTGAAKLTAAPVIEPDLTGAETPVGSSMGDTPSDLPDLPEPVLPPPFRGAPPPLSGTSAAGGTKVPKKAPAKPKGNAIQQKLQELLDAKSTPLPLKSKLRRILGIYNNLLDVSPEYRKIAWIPVKGRPERIPLEEHLTALFTNPKSQKALEKELGRIEDKLDDLQVELLTLVTEAAKAIGDTSSRSEKAKLLFQDPQARKIIRAGVSRPMNTDALRLRHRELTRSSAGFGEPAPAPPVQVDGMVYTPEELDGVDGTGYGNDHFTAQSYQEGVFPAFSSPDTRFPNESEGRDRDVAAATQALIKALKAKEKQAAANKAAIAEARTKKTKTSVKPISPLEIYTAIKNGNFDALMAVLTTHYETLKSDVQDIFIDYGADGEGMDVNDAQWSLQITLDRVERLQFAVEALRHHLQRAAAGVDRADLPASHAEDVEKLTKLGIWANYLQDMIKTNRAKANADAARFSRDTRDADEFGGVNGRALANRGRHILDHETSEAEDALVKKTTLANLTELDEKTGVWIARGLSLAILALSALYLAAAFLFGWTLVFPVALLIAAVLLPVPAMMIVFEFRKGDSPYSFSELFFATLPFRKSVLESAEKTTLDLKADQKGTILRDTRQLKDLAAKETTYRKLARVSLRAANDYMESLDTGYAVLVKYVSLFSLVLLAVGLTLTVIGLLGATVLLKPALVLLGAFLTGIGVSAAVLRWGVLKGTGITFDDWVTYVLWGKIRLNALNAVVENETDVKLPAMSKKSEAELKKTVAIVANGRVYYPKKDKRGFAVIKDVARILNELKRAKVKQISVVQLSDTAAAAAARSEVRTGREDAAGDFLAIPAEFLTAHDGFQRILPRLTALEAGRARGSYSALSADEIRILSIDLINQIVALENLRARGFSPDALLAQVRNAFTNLFGGVQELLLTDPANVPRQGIAVLASYNLALRLMFDATARDANQNRVVLANLPADRVDFALDLFDQIARLDFTLGAELQRGQPGYGAFEKAKGYAAAIRTAYPASARAEIRIEPESQENIQTRADLTAVAARSETRVSIQNAESLLSSAVKRVYEKNSYGGVIGQIDPSRDHAVRKTGTKTLRAPTQIGDVDVILLALKDFAVIARAAESGNIEGDAARVAKVRSSALGYISVIVSDLLDANSSYAGGLPAILKAADGLYDLAGSLLLNDNAPRDSSGLKAVQPNLPSEILNLGLTLFSNAVQAYGIINSISPGFLGDNNLQARSEQYLAKVGTQYAPVISVRDQLFKGVVRTITPSDPLQMPAKRVTAPLISVGNTGDVGILNLDSVLNVAGGLVTLSDNPSLNRTAAGSLEPVLQSLTSPNSNLAGTWDAQLKIADQLYDWASQMVLNNQPGVERDGNNLKPVLSGRSASTIDLARKLFEEAVRVYARIETSAPAGFLGENNLKDRSQQYLDKLNAAYPARSEVRLAEAPIAVAPVISVTTAQEREAAVTAPLETAQQPTGIDALAPIADIANQVLSQFSGDADLNQISQVFDAISAQRRDSVIKPAQEQIRNGISAYLRTAVEKGQNLSAVILSPEFEAEIGRLTSAFAEQVFSDEQVRQAFASSLQEKFSAQLQRYVINSVILGYNLQQAQAAQNIQIDSEAQTQFIALDQKELETRYQALLTANKGTLVIDGVQMPANLFASATPDSKTSYVLDASFANEDYMKVLLEAEHPIAVAYAVGTPGEKTTMGFAKELPGLMRMIFATLGSRNDQPVDLNRLSKVNFSPDARKTLVGTRLAVKNGGEQGDTVVQAQENFVNVVGESQFLPLMVRFLATSLVNQLPEVRQDGSRIVVLDEKHLAIFLNLVKKLTTEYRSEIRAAQSA